VAGLALNEAVHLALLAQICTAMGTEALLGVRGNYAPFIHEVARPHPGQVRFQIVHHGLSVTYGYRLTDRGRTHHLGFAP
jgi:phenylalanine ammonia-lyase